VLGGNKQVARNSSHRVKDTRISDTSALNLVLNHAFTQAIEISAFVHTPLHDYTP
jgi:hypothetical protein